MEGVKLILLYVYVFSVIILTWSAEGHDTKKDDHNVKKDDPNAKKDDPDAKKDELVWQARAEQAKKAAKEAYDPNPHQVMNQFNSDVHK